MSAPASAMTEQGYLDAAERHGCHNCRHAAKPEGAVPGRLWCGLGGFWVRNWSVCRAHRTRPQGGRG